MEILLGQFGSVIRAITIIGVAAMLIMFGLKPFTRILLEQTPAQLAVENGSVAAGNLAVAGGAAAGLPPPGGGDDGSAEEAARGPSKSPQRRLEKIVNLDEEQAAAILKQWLHQART